MTEDAKKRLAAIESLEDLGVGFTLATHDLEIYQNTIRDNRSVGTAVVSYVLVAALNEGEQEREESIGGVQSVNNRFEMDTLYNPYPYRINIHHNKYENSHWFPSTSNDIGKLFIIKSFMSPPDIVFDGISDPPAIFF